MKKTLLGMYIAAISSLTLADHHVSENYFYLGGHLSRHYFDLGGHVSPADFNDGDIPGALLGARFKDQWSIQGWWGQGDMDLDAAAGKAGFSYYFISARHHYQNSQWLGFEPYSGAAVGRLEVEGNEETLGAFEMGMQRHLGHNSIFEVGLRPNYSFDNERWNGEIYAAISIAINISRQ